ncbi:uncharacterized protein LOC117222550 [Megalopta genalis]|uniref:uncharacterized protein LOC117222550 n=1 Tax=Megalopta genalis TaxID=115081 RepID=UPI001442FBCD|nr:uncharacterized protein LOC117222550 [Megalopta genalis]
MFARLVLVFAAIFGFVYARNIECCESETSTMLDGAAAVETMEHQSVPGTENQQQPVHVDILPRTITRPAASHAHAVPTHPKKRAIGDKRKEDPQQQQMDPRPGCCG